MTWLASIVAAAHEALCASTPEAAQARAYLYDRGLTNADILTHRLGFWAQPPTLPAPADFHQWAVHYGYDRVLFPLTDGFGQPIGLQVRHLGAKGYENYTLKPTELYLPVFGLGTALPVMYRTGRVVLVEGVFDYFAMVRYAPDTLATLTANVSNAVKRLISRYCNTVVCVYDMDQSGRRGAYKLAGLPVPPMYRKPEDIGKTFKLPPAPPFVVHIPHYSAHDPDDLRKAGRAEEFLRIAAIQPLVSTAQLVP